MGLKSAPRSSPGPLRGLSGHIPSCRPLLWTGCRGYSGATELDPSLVWQGHQSTSISKFSQPQSWDRDAKILIYLAKSSITVQYISDPKWKTKATVQAGKVTGYKYRAPLLGYHKNLWTSVPKRFSHLTTRSSLSYQVVLAGLCPKKGSERFYNPVTKSV